MATDPKVLYIIRGASGSGKSTLANKITPCAFAADDYFCKNGKYKFNPEKLKEAHEWCKEQVQWYMMLGAEEIAVHNTFTRRWEVEPYLQLAEKYVYKVVEIIVKLSLIHI